jgi:AraC family transcriptional regulator
MDAALTVGYRNRAEGSFEQKPDGAMDNIASMAVSECETPDTSTAERDGQWSESCAAMTVAHVTRVPQAGLGPAPDMIEVLIPGDQAVFEAVFPLPQGCRQTALVRGPYVAVIPANRPHFIRSQRRPEMILLALNQAFYREKVHTALGIDAPDIALNYAVMDPLIRELGNAIRTEYRLLHLPGAVYLESLASVIAIHLATNYGRNHVESGVSVGLPRHKLNRVLAFIDEHVADTVPVDELASTVHMSPCHFARMFKQTVGQAPHVYITGQRMERAKELLRNTDLPLVDVAASAGFQTQAHFAGVFRKHAGVTPRMFRLNWRTGYVGSDRESGQRGIAGH